MIFQAIFAMLATVISGIFSVIIPSLPQEFNVVFREGVGLLSDAMGFVWLFVDKNYLASLCMWWIGFASVAFTVELAMEVWRAITGNFGGQDVSAEMVTETEYEHKTNPISGNHVIIRSSYSRSSSKTKRRLPKLPH